MYLFRKTLAAGLLASVAALSSSSCVDNNSSFFIYGVMDINNSQCVAKPDTSAALVPEGTMDRLFADGYQAAFLVGIQGLGVRASRNASERCAREQSHGLVAPRARARGRLGQRPVFRDAVAIAAR